MQYTKSEATAVTYSGYQSKDISAENAIELLQDLTWIKKSGIILVIYEYGEFLSAEPSLKGEFESDLERLIQWWTEDVVGHMVAGFPRPFQVYLEVE